MLGWNFRIVWKILVVASLLSPFVLFSSSLKSNKSNNVIGWAADNFIYPIQYVWFKSLQFVGDTWAHYIDLSHAAQENAELRHKLEVLNASLLDYQETHEEVGRLRQMLGFNVHHKGEHIVAEVVGMPKNTPFEILRISKGSNAGIRVGMSVINGVGVIGRVIKTGLYHSDVQLLVDGNFYIDVLLQRTRARGVLSGDFSSRCTLKLNRGAEVRIGDTIVTSGLVGSFPKGIPVGKVVRISYELDNITQVISVEPWVNPSQVEEVVVLKDIDANVQKILDTAGESWLEQSIESAGRGRG